MNLIRLDDLTINLDQIAFWSTFPKPTPGQPPPNAAKVTIHFVGTHSLELDPAKSSAFVEYTQRVLQTDYVC